MPSVSKAPIGGIAKLMLVLFVIFSVAHLVDFIYYGREPRNLISAIAFALMSFGIYKNGFANEAPDPVGRYASIVGIVMALVAIAMRYLA